MEKLIDGWDLAAQIRMERQIHKGSFLMVEGHNDDRTLSDFLDENECSVVISFGKKNAIEALKLLEDEGFEGVVCVVDADFEVIDGVRHDCDSLIITDHHDLDVTMFMSKAFERVLDKFGRKDRWTTAYSDARQVRVAILAATVPLASLKRVSLTRDWGLDFKELDFSSFISAHDLSCDVAKMVGQVLANSSPTAQKAAGAYLASGIRIDNSEPSMLCGGHDVMNVFGVGLRACS